MQLTPQQQDALEQLHDFAVGNTPHGAATLQGYAGTGKEQPVSCMVQTPNGPRRIGDIRIGDRVFGRAGRPVTVMGVFPQGVKPVYRVTFRDMTSTRCGSEHLWCIGTAKKSSGWRVMTTREIMERGLCNSAGMKFRIPLCEPVEYGAKNHQFDPYIIGVLIGDGSLCGNTPQVSCSDADIDIIERVIKLLPDGFRVSRRDTGGCWQYGFADDSIRGNRLKDELDRLGLRVLSGEKHIPQELLMSSVESRRALLSGLMDTDGSSSGNRISFHTTSEKLSDDVCTLVQSLGGVAIKHAYDRSADRKPTEYRINVKTAFNPFRCSRKAANWKLSEKNPPSRCIRSIEADGEEEQVCIMVDADDHLYLTDAFIVTHNTTLVAQLIARIGKRMRVLVTAPTHKALAVLGDKLDGAECELATTQAALGMKLVELDSGEQRLQKEGASRIDQYDLVVIDEASMLDPDLFAAAISRRVRAKILFVGDPAQLAPVGSDELSLAFSDIVPMHVRLNEVVRQAEEHPSIRLSVALREDVAQNRSPSLAHLAALLKPGDENHIAITPGGDESLQACALDAIRHGLDARILAFTNRATLRHNEAIHAALHPGVDGFAVGEKVIAQDGFTMKKDGFESAQVRTSQILTVRGVTEAQHPDSPDIPAWSIRLEQECGAVGTAWVARNRKALENEISELFGQWRRFKQAADSATNFEQRQDAIQAGKKASTAAWALRNRFANIRHAYALTIHKSQGSTFETVLVDWSSVPHDAGGDAARLAYVAITRPSKFAVIVTA